MVTIAQLFPGENCTMQSGQMEAPDTRLAMINPEPSALLGQSEAWHRTLGGTNTQRVPKPRFTAKGTSSYFAPILNVPIKALIGPSGNNSLNAVIPGRNHARDSSTTSLLYSWAKTSRRISEIHPFKIHPLDQIRRDRYSALRAHLVPAMPALLPDRVFVIGALQTPREL